MTLKRHSRAEVGSLAEWVAALATIAALVAAFAAARFAAAAVRIERDRDDHRDREARMSQAKLVAAIAAVESVSRADLKFGGGTTAVEKRGAMLPVSIKLTVLNASPVPIWHFVLMLSLPAVDPGGKPVAVGKHRIEPPILPGSIGPVEILNEPLKANFQRLLATYPDGGQEAAAIRIAWRFADNTGRRWHGAPGEPLTELLTSG